MAIAWIAAFKTIPWTKVLAATPLIVQGARSLWAGGTKKNPPDPSPEGQRHSETISTIDARLRALELQVGQLREDAVSSSGLIKSLAEQDSELVQAVEILRKRTSVLLWACGFLVTAIVVLYILLRAH